MGQNLSMPTGRLFCLQADYDAWSIKNTFVGPILFADLRLLTDGYTFVFKLQHVIFNNLFFNEHLLLVGFSC